MIEKIRKAIEDDIVLSLKIDSENGDNDGISEEEFLTACKLAEKTGIDIIQVTGFKWIYERPKNSPFYFEAEFILNNSNIQYIGLSRALLCEPDLIIRWKNGDKKKCVIVA